VPLAGDYVCSFDSVQQRNLYDNHPGLESVQDEVRDRFAKEEAQSFHLALPRFLWRFIVGIHLAALVWAIRKMKGRLCVDPSSRISSTDDGAANDSIPPPGAFGCEDECPPIYYASALHRHLTWIWRLRLQFPWDDIIQFVDDIHAAFHRVLYHPDAGILFASVFMEFLIIPIGTIFGARNSPSFFCLFSELRAHVSSNTVYRINDDPKNFTALTRRVRLVAPMTIRERFHLVQAVPDELHTGVPPAQVDRYHNSTFVDDNGLADLRTRILGAIDNSVRAAYDIFGHPNDDRRAPCLSEEKWLLLASFAMVYLGFYIDTRRLIMAWPVEKREQLAQLIDDILADVSSLITPKQSSSLLGLIRNAAVVAPLGVYLSLRLQHALNEATRGAWQVLAFRTGSFCQWYRLPRIRLTRETVRDLRLLRSKITFQLEDPTWCRPIGLLVGRSPTSLSYSDASYQGLGGWSGIYQFMWRLSRDDLTECGFDMKILEEASMEPIDDADNDGLHINVLEFVALIINIWFALVSIQRLGNRVGGHVIAILADNTSALSWMRHASRSHRPAVRELSRFVLDLTLSCLISHKMSGRHIEGKKNVGADKLSRFDDPPEGGGRTWASVISQHSPLRTCRAYRLPRELLSSLVMILSSAKTGVPYEPPTTRLLTLVPCTLSVGSEGNASTTSLSGRRRRSKRSR
jgi:hypothetical protein